MEGLRLSAATGGRSDGDGLRDLVETYENTHVSIPPVSGVEPLRYRMDEHGLMQADLVPLLGPPSIVYVALSGKRHLARRAARFGLPADVFIARP